MDGMALQEKRVTLDLREDRDRKDKGGTRDRTAKRETKAGTETRDRLDHRVYGVN